MATACAQPQNLIHLDSPEVMNQVYYPLLLDRKRYQVLCGGGGSGKSDYAAMDKIIRCMDVPAHRMLVTRKVGATLRESCFQALLDIIDRFNLNRWWSPNKSSLSLTYLEGTHLESRIFCVGVDQVKKIKSIQRITSMWHEEPTELSRKEFMELDIRMRGRPPPGHYYQHVLTFNPESEYHWLRKAFFEIDGEEPGFRPEKCTVLTTTADDNKFVDQEYIDMLDDLARQDTNLYKIYRLGQWGSLKGLIFDTPWPEAEFPSDLPYSKITYGVDFGFNDPMVVTRSFVHDQCHTFDEMLYERHMTTGDLITWFGENGVHRDSEMYCDNAEPDRIEEICRAGYNAFPCKKGAGSIKTGLSMLQGLKGKGQGFITPRSANAKKERAAYKWMENKAGELLDQPVDAFNHFWDTVRYIVFTKFHELASGIC